MERMTVTVKVTDGWMVKALAKQIHTMKWNGRAPGVIVEKPRPVYAGFRENVKRIREALERIDRVLNDGKGRML